MYVMAFKNIINRIKSDLTPNGECASPFENFQISLFVKKVVLHLEISRISSKITTNNIHMVSSLINVIA